MVDFGAPKKLLVLISGVPPAALQAINTIIMSEEGGWKATYSQSGDNDGGWTYGGMTSSTFSKYFDLSQQDVKTLLEDTVKNATQIELFQKAIVCVYYQEFYVPIISHGQETMGSSPEACHLSCAINCGVGACSSLMRQASTVGSRGNMRKEFLRLWMAYYGTICQNNHDKIIFIHGWMNRVMSYTN